MATLIYGRKAVWDEIFTSKDAKPAKKAAIAFFSKGAKLQFRRGDLLVVDASKATIESGGTSPSRLLKLAGAGVDVRHYAGLHAKVICFAPAPSSLDR